MHEKHNSLNSVYDKRVLCLIIVYAYLFIQRLDYIYCPTVLLYFR